MKVVMLTLLATGCGLGLADDTSGGSDGLPSSGAGPYQRLEGDETTPADEPWLATDRLFDFTEPAIVRRDGGGFVFFLTRESPDEPAGDTVILRGALRDPHQLPDEPAAIVLTADQPWEEGHVAAPAIVVLPDRLVMFYEGGLAAPQLGRAVSTDGGHTWQKDAAPLVAGAREPGAAFDGTTWLLAFVRPGQSGAWLARSSDGVAFAPDAEPFLLPTGTEDSFERVAVASPALAWVVESSGRGHFALWYGGLEDVPGAGDPPRYAVGYAASFDGLAWDRPAGGRPVLAAPAGAPTVLVEGPTATLLFQARNGLRPAVGIARHP
jgi:hypothetical protein